jgi:predicted secreted protein
MTNKETFSKIGIFFIIFILLVFFIMTQGSDIWATLDTVDINLANQKTLQFLWTTLVTAILIQGFLIYSALLGANSQFSLPSKKTKGEI